MEAGSRAEDHAMCSQRTECRAHRWDSRGGGDAAKNRSSDVIMKWGLSRGSGEKARSLSRWGGTGRRCWASAIVAVVGWGAGNVGVGKGEGSG